MRRRTLRGSAVYRVGCAVSGGRPIARSDNQA